MTVDIAAGVVTHNGNTVAVAAATNAVTLIADGSNPRWAWIHVTSAGVAGVTHGTAAATPAKPELGDNVCIAAVFIPASETIASNCTPIPKRIPAVPAATHQPAQIITTSEFVSRGGPVANTSAAWTTTNTCVYVPFVVARNITVKQIHLLNGTTPGGLVDVGIFDSDDDGLPQTRLAADGGGTTQAGANAYQTFNIADVVLSAGLYYAAMNATTTAQVKKMISADVDDSRSYSIYEQAVGALALPSTASPAILTATRVVPIMVLNRATT
jgi:hypothetical protein